MTSELSVVTATVGVTVSTGEAGRAAGAGVAVVLLPAGAGDADRAGDDVERRLLPVKVAV